MKIHFRKKVDFKELLKGTAFIQFFGIVIMVALVTLTGCIGLVIVPAEIATNSSQPPHSNGVPMGSISTAIQSNKCGGDKHCKGLQAPKIGKACAQSYLGLYLVGDMSMKTAMQNGRIKKVSSIDTKQTSILMLVYQENCIYVHGN